MLVTELQEVGFYFFKQEQLNDILIEEIEHVVNAATHEGRRPRYGSIMVSDRQDRILPFEPKDVTPTVDLDIVRQLADGRFSFVCRTPDSSQLIRLSRSFSDEYALFSIRDDFLRIFPIDCVPPWDMGIVQRCEEGIIRVFGPRNIAIRRHEKWTKKEYKYAHVLGLGMSALLSNEEIVIVRELVSLCVHGLSAQHVGCTIVYKRTDGDFLDTEPLGNHALANVSYLRVDDGRWHNALVELLAQKDGAVLVKTSGEIEMIGARLKDGEIPNVLPSPGGTRHNSAKRYSASHKDCILFVVSSEGGITIFLSGAEILPKDPLDPRTDPAAICRCKICGVYHAMYACERVDSNCLCKRCGNRIVSDPEHKYVNLRIRVSKFNGANCYPEERT